MTILQCKMCGGNIEVTGESHGRCDSCGCEVTLPKIDDSKRADMYNRGNRFRTMGEFDKAYSAYEHIIADNQQDAEAHWCLMLCRYGVDYVKDARTGDYKPTVSRMSLDPILDDPDYLAALAASDEYSKEIYRREAQKIASIQKQYLEISRKEQPYDVFICFKAEDARKNRTRASELGQDIYEQLIQKGLKVFFSRITLEDKLAEAYEPYIFAALNSAKVMLLVADQPEQLEARWVKNEWSRYLKMMETDKSKYIVPTYVGMSKYDFPIEIPMAQAQDMSAVGAMQDLVRGVCKITGHLYHTAASAADVQGATVESLLRRAKQSWEDGAAQEAKTQLEEVLNRDPENAEAYYLGFLLEYGIDKFPTVYTEMYTRWGDNHYFKRALQYSKGEMRAKLEDFNNYCLLWKSMNLAKAFCNSKEYFEAQEELERAEKLLAQTTAQDRERTFFKTVRQQIEQGFRDDAAAREAAIRRAEALKEYKAAVADNGNYLIEQMEKCYPKQCEKYNSLKQGFRKASQLAYTDSLGIAALISAIMYCFMAFTTSSDPLSAGGSVSVMIVFACFAVPRILLDRPIKFLKTFIAAFMGSVIVEGMFMAAFHEKAPMLLIYFLGLLGIALVARGVIRTLNTFALPRKKEQLDNYYNYTIMTLEDGIREEVAKEWGKKIGKGNLVHLYGLEAPDRN